MKLRESEDNLNVRILSGMEPLMFSSGLLPVSRYTIIRKCSFPVLKIGRSLRDVAFLTSDRQGSNHVSSDSSHHLREVILVEALVTH